MARPESKYFEFVLRLEGPNRIKIRVYRAETTGKPIPRLTPRDIADRPRKEAFQSLLNLLTSEHIRIEPNPTATLIEDRSTRLRIDTQPATTKFRNIHLQRGNLSYSAVTIDYGAELCYLVDFYDKKLLKFIKQGLVNSFETSQIFNIRVEITEKTNKEKQYERAKEEATAETVRILCAVVQKCLKNNGVKEVTEKCMASAKNANKIARGTELVEHISVAIEKQIAKLTGKEAEHVIAKKIPVVSAIMGLVFGVQRLAKGDYAGALAEAASGAIGWCPGIGTAVSVGIDLALIGKDIASLVEKEKTHMQLQKHDIAQLKEQNKRIRREVNQLLPESPIYGDGKRQYFDETEMSNFDVISQINIACDEKIYGIQMVYRHGGPASWHGSSSVECMKGSMVWSCSLDPDEKITTVRGTIHFDKKYRLRQIASLTFETDYGRTEPFGRDTGLEPFSFVMTDGAHLAAIKGYNQIELPGAPSRHQYRNEPSLGFIAKY